jgi:hypothetical protein
MRDKMIFVCGIVHIICPSRTQLRVIDSPVLQLEAETSINRNEKGMYPSDGCPSVNSVPSWREFTFWHPAIYPNRQASSSPVAGRPGKQQPTGQKMLQLRLEGHAPSLHA